MIDTRLLTPTAFRSTMVEPMHQPPAEDAPAVDIWPYIDAIPAEDLGPYSIGENDVAEVSRTGDRRYDHVLIAASVENVYLVVVVDLRRRDVMGHHLLDLNREYGLGPDG